MCHIIDFIYRGIPILYLYKLDISIKLYYGIVCMYNICNMCKLKMIT